MQRDTVAMGFVTGLSDAVVVRIESASSNDYLEIEIVIKFFSIVFFLEKKLSFYKGKT